MSEFFTSDFHLDDERVIGVHNRPFGSVKEMNEVILGNLNSAVKRNDTLYYLGDFAYGSVEKAIKFRDQINCKNVFLIYGNHDCKHRFFREYRKSFGKGRCHDIYEIERDKRLIVMCHYPMTLFRKWDRPGASMMLHGHAHGRLKPKGGYHCILDVGVDNNNFKPFSYEDVMAYMMPRFEQYAKIEPKEDLF